jgi:hypothetical protein
MGPCLRRDDSVERRSHTFAIIRNGKASQDTKMPGTRPGIDAFRKGRAGYRADGEVICDCRNCWNLTNSNSRSRSERPFWPDSAVLFCTN